MNDRISFPDGFLWGTATSAYQVEGRNNAADWFEWERDPSSGCAEPAGVACDHYHLYAEDVALLARLGFNSYRFSVEWSRIQPEEDVFLDAEVDHYRRMLETCHGAGLRAALAFHHFTNPAWVARDGGWEDPRTPDRFARFCERVAPRLGDLLELAITINEPNMPPLLGYLDGIFPPGKRDPAAWELVTKNFVRAHELARSILKEHTAAPVGLALALADWQVLEGGERELEAITSIREQPFLDIARDDDYIGVNTYTRHRVGPEGFMAVEDRVELTVMGYEFWPEALEATVRRAAADTGRPVYVTESGIGTDEDARRIAFIDAALRGIGNCLSDGIDVRGYYYWSAFDNFEWNHGYGPRFGLVAVDRETQERTIKPSARWLGDVARAGRL